MAEHKDKDAKGRRLGQPGQVASCAVDRSISAGCMASASTGTIKDREYATQYADMVSSMKATTVKVIHKNKTMAVVARWPIESNARLQALWSKMVTKIASADPPIHI